MATRRPTRALRRAYELMFTAHGHQHWWPGDTPFEICVGAILTQNTSWTNVEKAIANLKRAKVLSPGKMFEMPVAELAELIRPAGYYNLKADRLRSFLEVLQEEHGGRMDRLFAGDTSEVRERVLAIKGVGPETADSMLLYAGDHHRFVIDGYTKRIFQRHNWWAGVGEQAKAKVNTKEEYESLQKLCEDALGQKSGEHELDYWQDYHAQLVVIGKDFCKTRNPNCEECPLKPLLSR
ncbi:MAG: endonuclease III domain-containing protein [Limisphaerales bacterium]